MGSGNICFPSFGVSRQLWRGVLMPALAAIVFIMSGGISAQPAYLDVDYFVCSVPSSLVAPLDSHLYDDVATRQLEHETFWQTRADMQALLRHRVLGERYERGDGVPRSLDEAIRHYRRAALVIGETSAIYSPGVGGAPGSVSVSSSGAKRPGDLIAMKRLGEMYRDGVGMAADARRGQILIDCATKLIPAEKTPVATYSAPVNSPGYIVEPPRQTWKSVTAPKVGSAMLENEIATISLPERIHAIRWNASGTQLAAIYGENGRFVTLLDVNSGKQLWTLERPVSQQRRALQFSPDGVWLYIGSAIMAYKRNPETTISIVSTTNGQVARTFFYKVSRVGDAFPQDIAISTNGKTLYVVPGMANEVIAHDVASGSVTPISLSKDVRDECGTGFSFARLAIDDVRGQIWFAHEGAVELWPLSGGTAKRLIQAFAVGITAMQVWNQTGELIVGGSANSETCRYPVSQPDSPLRNYEDDPATLIRAFDPNTGKLARSYAGPGGSVEGLSLDANGGVLAAVKSRMLGASNAYILLWDIASADLLAARDLGQKSGLGDVAFDGQGSRLAYVERNTIHFLKIAR